eukprot:COSAG01_NODE_21669_length_891_cov_1.217172_2_plen_47_part_00
MASVNRAACREAGLEGAALCQEALRDVYKIEDSEACEKVMNAVRST